MVPPKQVTCTPELFVQLMNTLPYTEINDKGNSYKTGTDVL